MRHLVEISSDADYWFISFEDEMWIDKLIVKIREWVLNYTNPEWYFYYSAAELENQDMLYVAGLSDWLDYQDEERAKHEKYILVYVD